MTTFWTIVKAPVTGRHYSTDDAVCDGCLHESREAAIGSVVASLDEIYGPMGYHFTGADTAGNFFITEDESPNDVCTRVDSVDTTRITLAPLETFFLISQLNS